MTLYAVIFWDKKTQKGKIRFLTNGDGSVWTTQNIDEADNKGLEFEKTDKHDTRTISLESVME